MGPLLVIWERQEEVGLLGIVMVDGLKVLLDQLGSQPTSQLSFGR